MARPRPSGRGGVPGISFNVVKGKRFSDESMNQVLAILKKFLGDDMRIDVEFHDNIEMVRTGKRLATVSKLGIDFQKIQAS